MKFSSMLGILVGDEKGSLSDAEAKAYDLRVELTKPDNTAAELLWILRRALNTCEPSKAPQWALKLCDELEEGDSVIIIREPA